MLGHDAVVVEQRTRRRWRHGMGVVVLAAIILSAGACTGGGTNGDGTSPGSRSTDSAPRGGTLRVVIPLNRGISPLSERPALDPQSDWWSDSFEVFRCCLLRTLLAHPGLPTDEGGAILHPDLAEEMPEVSRDGLTWTFHLKDGLTYAPPLQDTEIVAGDVVRALEREAAVASTATYAFYYSAIEGFDAVVQGDADSISGLETPDESTLIVHLTQPAGEIANLFAMPATAPIPPNPSRPTSRLGIAAGLDGFGRFLVASGPYMIEGSEDLDLSVPSRDRLPISGYVPGRSLTLVRNPSWERGTDLLRPAYADRIEFALGPGIDETVRLIRGGEADVLAYDRPAPQFPIDVVQRFLDHPELGVQVHLEPRDLVRFLNMNLAMAPLDDLHVRKAISYAIDKQALLDLRGGPVVGGIAGHVVLDSMENGLLESYDPYPTSLAKARQEMARSRYDDDGDGRCDHAVCKGLMLLSSKGFAPIPMDELAVSIRRDLEGIGIDLRIETPKFREAYSAAYDPSARVPLAIFTAWGKDFLNASSFVPSLFSSQSIGSANTSLVGATPAQLRTWGYDVTSVPNIDDKIGECQALVGDLQVRCWAEADQLLMEQVVPAVPYVFENKVQLVSDRVVAYSFDQFAGAPALDRIAVSPHAA
jgi:peptide/nickel transport system substrate-binding protein